MKAIDSAAYLVCAVVLALVGFGSGGSTVNAQSVQSQSQTDNRARALQSQPPKINTDQEWHNAVEFMKANCPNRINFVTTQLPNRPIQFERAKELILKQYRQIANQKDPQIHEVAVKQAQIQDNVFGLQLKIKSAGPRPDPRELLNWQTALKAEMDQLVNVQIVLRQVKIARLQAEVDRFQKKRQEYVTTWYNDELKRAMSNNLDGTGHGAEDAVVDDNAVTPPRAPPVRK